MPNVNGYQFIERIKNDEMFMDIPLIVMSSTPKLEAISKLQAYNVECYISKDTFNQQEFTNIVKEVITKYHV